MKHFSTWSDTVAARMAADRQSLARRETENFLREFTQAEFDARRQRWAWDYSSPEAYRQSLTAMRQAWSDSLGVFEFTPQLHKITQEPFFETDALTAYWLTLPLTDTLCARAVFAVPKNVEPPYRLVIAQHGISSSPERVFGLDDEKRAYHAYGQRLAEAGYAVLAPQHITEAGARGRYTNMCLMLGRTLWGFEIGKLRAWLDYIQQVPQIQAKAIGMWGISLGGAYTLFTAAIEDRIRVAICTAWFNDRLPKMIIDDPRYSCFLSTVEGHIYIPNWLTDFGDAELVSLIAPRPFLSQTGKGDSISWWPNVVEEFSAAQNHYARLGLSERIELDLHNGGHEIRVDSGLAFLDRWLGKSAVVG